MKTKFIIFLIIFIPQSLFSQSYKQEIAGIKKVKIVDIYGDIKINSIASDKIKIEATGFLSISPLKKSRWFIPYL